MGVRIKFSSKRKRDRTHAEVAYTGTTYGKWKRDQAKGKAKDKSK